MSRKSRIAITDDMHQALCDHRDRTGVAAQHLLFNQGTEIPAGLDSAIINSWFTRKTKSARAGHWSYVIDRYEALPDNPWVEIDDALQVALEEWHSTLDVPLSVWIRKHPPPIGVNYAHIRNALTGNISKVRKDVLAYLFDGVADK